MAVETCARVEEVFLLWKVTIVTIDPSARRRVYLKIGKGQSKMSKRRIILAFVGFVVLVISLGGSSLIFNRSQQTLEESFPPGSPVPAGDGSTYVKSYSKDPSTNRLCRFEVIRNGSVLVSGQWYRCHSFRFGSISQVMILLSQAPDSNGDLITSIHFFEEDPFNQGFNHVTWPELLVRCPSINESDFATHMMLTEQQLSCN